jgi:hypothetical protein
MFLGYPGTSAMPQTVAISPALTTSSLDEGHWRAAAEEGVRIAAKQWRIPLKNFIEMTLIDADEITPAGPCYLFKALYLDQGGQRRAGAVYMLKGRTYTSPLSMSMLTQPRSILT